MLYRALTPIGYNGTRYVEGDQIDLDEASAAALLARGGVELVEHAAAPDPAPAQSPAQADPIDDFIGEPDPAPAPAPAPEPQKPKKAFKAKG